MLMVPRKPVKTPVCYRNAIFVAMDRVVVVDNGPESATSSATDRSGTARGDFATAAGFLANKLVDVRGGVGGVCTSREIAIGALELHRRHGSWAVQRVQARARRLCRWAAGLASSIGDELLLVEIHLALDVGVGPLVGSPGREGWLRRIGASLWSGGGARVLRGCKVGGMKAWQRRQPEVVGGARGRLTGMKWWSSTGLGGNGEGLDA
jgi:hypothetical protein